MVSSTNQHGSNRLYTWVQKAARAGLRDCCGSKRLSRVQEITTKELCLPKDAPAPGAIGVPPYELCGDRGCDGRLSLAMHFLV